ncbi:MFS transporter [Furfurilactobacillus rossiae]|nr:MFS transporter [Furfurilactobacillus milii]
MGPLLKRWLILSILGSFFFMVIIDGSIVSIAIPTIARDLSVSTNATTTIIGIYLITISALLLFFGQLGDQLGRPFIFEIGTALFLIGSGLAGFGINLPFVLFGRFVQAVGASMTMANSYAIVTDTFPPQYLGRALGIEALFISLGSLAGPGLGGLILAFLPWGYIFWINVPLGIICLIAECFIFPRPGKLSRPNVDWLGVGDLIVLAVSFFVASSVIMTHPLWATIGLIIFFAMIAVFVYHERRATRPLLNLNLLKNSAFTQNVVAALISFVVGYFFTLLAPIYLQIVLKYSSQVSGLLLMASPIVALVANPIAGTLTDKFNKQRVMAAGLIILLLAQIGLVLSNGHVEPIVFIGVSALIAIGTAVFGTPNNTLIMQSVSTADRGMAGSINSLMREFGLVLGTTLSTLTFYVHLSFDAGRRTTTAIGQSAANIIAAQRTAYLFGLLLLAGAGIIVFNRARKRTIAKNANLAHQH